MSTTVWILPKILKAVSLFAIATGSLDLILGSRMAVIGSGMEGNTTDFAIGSALRMFVDTQFRFFGSMWAGFGVMLWWTSNDLQNRKMPLRLLEGIMFAAGIGRMLSGMEHGFNATWVPVAMCIELLGPGVLHLLGY